MADSHRRPVRLGFLVVPLLLLPIGLTQLLPAGSSSFLLLAFTCFASVAGGFWWGEMRGRSEPSRIGLGCVSTLVLLVTYLIVIFGVLEFPFAD
ncbi:MAG TPA: hypothetical protein VGO90_01525 [Chthoniobacteraceae bacterium]|jgi:hypothetical protein|nr:hypothetical protein [Chthoniobacteraceae bacterium]